MAVSPARPSPRGATATTGKRAPRRGRGTAGRRPDQLKGGRHGLSADEVERSQRERIERAMTAIVAEDGYHGARVSEVVWRAGVSRKTFYQLYGGKEGCFGSTYVRHVDRLLGIARAAFDAQADWVARLRAALTALLGELARDPAVARLCFVEAVSAGGEVAALRDERVASLETLFDAPDAPAGTLGESLRAGRVSELTEALRREIAAGRADGLPRQVPELMYAMVLPFLGPDAARRELERDAAAAAR